jgi:hypothetical protein
MHGIAANYKGNQAEEYKIGFHGREVFSSLLIRLSKKLLLNTA